MSDPHGIGFGGWTWRICFQDGFFTCTCGASVVIGFSCYRHAHSSFRASSCDLSLSQHGSLMVLSSCVAAGFQRQNVEAARPVKGLTFNAWHRFTSTIFYWSRHHSAPVWMAGSHGIRAWGLGDIVAAIL